LEDYKLFIKDRIEDEEIYKFLVRRIDKHINFLFKQLEKYPDLTYKKLLKNPDEITDIHFLEDQWVVVNSLRDVNPSSVIKVEVLKEKDIKNRRTRYD